jgi:hypothetical protein
MHIETARPGHLSGICNWFSSSILGVLRRLEGPDTFILSENEVKGYIRWATWYMCLTDACIALLSFKVLVMRVGLNEFSSTWSTQFMATRSRRIRTFSTLA